MFNPTLSSIEKWKNITGRKFDFTPAIHDPQKLYTVEHGYLIKMPINVLEEQVIFTATVFIDNSMLMYKDGKKFGTYDVNVDAIKKYFDSIKSVCLGEEVVKSKVPYIRIYDHSTDGCTKFESLNRSRALTPELVNFNLFLNKYGLGV